MHSFTQKAHIHTTSTLTLRMRTQMYSCTHSFSKAHLFTDAITHIHTQVHSFTCTHTSQMHSQVNRLTCTPTQKRTYHLHVLTHTSTFICVHTFRDALTYSFICSNTGTHTHVHTLKYIHILKCIHTLKFTRIHINMHTCVCPQQQLV